jgi:hypothetical protein
LLLFAAACATAPEEPPTMIVGAIDPDLKSWVDLADGESSWTWYGERRQGEARLTIAGSRFRWRLDGAPADSLVLVPAGGNWLTMAVGSRAELAATPPLPRLPVDSAAYPHLLAMVRDLITPRFGGLVTHWASWPVPVGSLPAISGEVDLAACLREAVTIWNEGEDAPWFAWKPAASSGVRLAHYAGGLRRPPLSLTMVRRDSLGRPLRMRIAAGDNYASEAARPYAVRGMVHELGHALLLWGHSPDRTHVLWGGGPPLRASPSADERRAARFLRLLPAGLDLRRYGVPPPQGDGHQVSRATGRPSSRGTAAAAPVPSRSPAAARHGRGQPAGPTERASTSAAPEERRASSIAR